jgi:CHAT domain-containing protein/tetratricopeptide (TPR) repeat protein
VGEANARWNLADLGVEPRANLEGAIELYRQAASILGSGPEFARCLNNEGNTRQRLATLGVESLSNFTVALDLHCRAEPIFKSGGDIATSLLGQANAKKGLAELGVEPQRGLEEALNLYRQAARVLVSGPRYANCVLSQGNVFQCLADTGLAQHVNLQAAIDCYRQAAAMLDSGHDYARCLLGEGGAWLRLAALTAEPRADLEAALDLGLRAAGLLDSGRELALCLIVQAEAKRCLADSGLAGPRSAEEAIALYHRAETLLRSGLDYARCLLLEGNASQSLADMGVNPSSNLEAAICLYAKARTFFDSGPDLGRCLMNEGAARQRLAEIGVDSRANLEDAIELYLSAAEPLSGFGPSLARCLENHANARYSLARLGVDSVENFLIATDLHEQASSILGPCQEGAACRLNQANAMQGLADLGVEPRANLEGAIELYRQAVAPCGQDRNSALSLVNQGAAMQSLADMGVESRSNYQNAVILYGRAAIIFHSGPDWARCLINDASARKSLARIGIDTTSNTEKAASLLSHAGEALVAYGFHSDAMNAYRSLSELMVHVQHWQPAREAAQVAATLLERVRSATRLVNAKRTWMEENANVFAYLVEATVHLGPAADALTDVERACSSALVDLMYLAEAKPHGINSRTMRRYTQLRRRLEELTAFSILGDGPTRARPNPTTTTTESLHTQNEFRSVAASKARVLRQLEKVEAEIHAADPEFLPLAPTLSGEEIQSVAAQLNRPLVYPWVGTYSSFAFIVPPTGSVEALPLPGVTTSIARQWLLGSPEDPYGGGWLGTYVTLREEQTVRPVSSDSSELSLAWSRWLNQLTSTLKLVYEHIMLSVHDWLRTRSYTRMVLISSGQVAMLPLHAAMWEGADAQCRYFLDQIDVIYAPSARVLRECHTRTDISWLPALAIGDPAEHGQPSAEDLPFSSWEVSQIARVVRKSHGDDAMLVVSADKASPDAVQELLLSHPTAHFACHGRWDPIDPTRSSLLLGDDGNPHPMHETNELSMGTLIGSSLTKARLVVLSACESAASYSLLGSGQEYLGFPAGFIAAGAASVVGSLWQVSDLATALLMIRFYSHLLEQVEIDVALRKSQAWLRDLSKTEAVNVIDRISAELVRGLSPRAKKEIHMLKSNPSDLPFQHPFYWAAFAAFGSPRSVGEGMPEATNARPRKHRRRVQTRNLHFATDEPMSWT